MKVATVAVKCPMCGENKAVERLGKTGIEGLDPMMEKFRCHHVTVKWIGDFDKLPWTKTSTACDTEFYVAPRVTYSEV
jgi:hypothetical protein